MTRNDLPHSAVRALLLLTDAFPYEVGEEFLEQEIEDLCAAYDHVVEETPPCPPRGRGTVYRVPHPPGACASARGSVRLLPLGRRYR